MSEATSITSGLLIAADKVKGTNVYNTTGDNLGTIDDILHDPRSKFDGASILGRLGLGRPLFALVGWFPRLEFGGFPV
jgi:hypothetical protein